MLSQYSASEYPPASRSLKNLVWLYFWLLIFEGALRKWVAPQLSAPLLIVRDPIMILILFKAMTEGQMPRTGFFNVLVLISVATTVLMVAQMAVLPVPKSVLVYGWRTCLLHLPLIFLMPQIFDRNDLLRMGRWILILSVPMAVLMAYQFRAPADAWVNRTAGVSGGNQIAAALGKIRPPGTFSFISGPVLFFSLATAFASYGLLLGSKVIPRWLSISGLGAISVAVMVSGSRSTILAAAIVVVVWLLGVSKTGRVSAGLTGLVIPLVLIFFVLGQMDVVREGSEVLTTRWQDASTVEEGQGGLLGRALTTLTEPLSGFFGYPLFGEGIGLGTNVGAMLASGRVQFLLAESEWGRVLGEMGPVFGGFYLLFRIVLTVWLAVQSFYCFRMGYILPLLLFSACGVNLFNGQFAQPTILGFAVFSGGLCLAAINAANPTALRSNSAG